MIVGTHLIIARIVYKYMLEKRDFKLDYPAFAYGCIKPDLDKKYISCWHTFEDSFNIIDAYSKELMRSKASVKEFSTALGVICHFVCDYFCLQHSREYWKRNPAAHGIYEVKLHVKLLKLYKQGNIKIRYKYRKEKDLEALMVKLRNRYVKEPRGEETDIAYALLAAICACEFIVCSSKIYSP